MSRDAMLVDKRKVGPLTVRVEYDDAGDANDPREWTNVSTIVEASGRYEDEPTGGYSNLTNYLIGHHDAIRETIDRIDVDGWDGWIFATPDGLKETGVTPENAREAVDQERKTFMSWLEGDVYGFVVEDENGHPLDSCWGYIGEPDYAMEEGVGSALSDPRYARWAELQSACRG